MVKHKLTRENYEAIRDHLFDRIHKTGEQVKNDFPNILRTAIKTEAWKHFTDGEGKPFTNLVEWLHHTFPRGIGMGQGQHAITYEEALKLTEGVADVHRVLLEHAPNKGRGGDRRSKAAKNQTLPTMFDRSQPASKATLSVRLAQEHPTYYDAYQRGEYRSVTAAATAAGLLKGGKNLQRAKSAYRKMSKEERAEFLKWVDSEDARKEVG